MTGTYQDMQDDITADLGSQSAVATTALIQSKIKSAIRHYQKERFWFLQATDTFTTTQGVESYALPSDLRAINPDLRLSDGTTNQPLRSRSSDYLNQHYTDSTEGRPRVFCIEAGLIRLRPIPDAVYTVTRVYFKELTELSGPTDTNAWLTHGEALIRARAKYELHMIDRQPDLASYCKAEADEEYAILLRQSGQILRAARLETYEAAGMASACSGYNINTDE